MFVSYHHKIQLMSMWHMPVMYCAEGDIDQSILLLLPEHNQQTQLPAVMWHARASNIILYLFHSFLSHSPCCCCFCFFFYELPLSSLYAGLCWFTNRAHFLATSCNHHLYTLARYPIGHCQNSYGAHWSLSRHVVALLHLSVGRPRGTPVAHPSAESVSL